MLAILYSEELRFLIDFLLLSYIENILNHNFILKYLNINIPVSINKKIYIKTILLHILYN